MTSKNKDLILEGDTILVQRFQYLRTFFYKRKDSVMGLGKETVDLTALEGLPYGSRFRMVQDNTKKGT